MPIEVQCKAELEVGCWEKLGSGVGARKVGLEDGFKMKLRPPQQHPYMAVPFFVSKKAFLWNTFTKPMNGNILVPFSPLKMIGIGVL